MGKNKNTKKRNWAFVLYPESAPEDWQERLQATGLQCAISPLHDKDVNPDGEPKKAHYHVILSYSGPTSYNVVKAITDELGQPIPQALEQVRGYYRYLTHRDNPEKYQYDEREIKTINGFNIADFIELTRAEVAQHKKAIQHLIRERGIYEYAELMDVLLDEELDTEYDVASSNTLFFDRYVSSRRHAPREVAEAEPVIDRETGEITGEILKVQEEPGTQPTPEQIERRCPECGSSDVKKKGKTAAEQQRFQCKECNRTFV